MAADGIVGEYMALKRESDADLLAMQMGDFYEFFGEDARVVGRELDLKVSQRSAGGEQYDMAGVPRDDVTPYLGALVERGYRVAVADQYETDDGGHARALSRTVTPGTLVETEREDAQYLATVVRDAEAGGDAGETNAAAAGSAGSAGAAEAVVAREYGLAFLDVTTGQFHVTAVEGASAALTELYRFAPTEILPGPAVRNDDAFLAQVRERSDATLTLHATDAFAPGRARHTLGEQFGDAAASVGLDSDEAVRAAGAALSYVAKTGIGALAAVTRLRTYQPSDHVAVDATTQRNLELTEPMTSAGQSLFGTIDRTVTSAGGRLLKEWLGRPRRDRAELERRQACVAALCEAALAREDIRETLDDAYDLERLASRAVNGSAGATDLLRVRDTLALVPAVADRVERTDRLADSPLADVLSRFDRDASADLHDALDAALAEDPPKSLTQGGLLREGFDDDLDALVSQLRDNREWFETLAEREQARTGISRLSVDRNKTDGYYLHVAKSQSDRVPDEYEGIKTLKNAERFVTPELREREREILRLEERRGDLEYDLFCDLRDRVAARAELLQDVGRALAELDAFGSLAAHAVRHGWTRPTLTEDDRLVVDAGRHPVVETTTEFVPNDLRLDRDRRFLVVTGPNMSGKSTYMRQAALITLLAQVGSFVPADHAAVGTVDGIYTRVGALDELAQGRSTFMVEMAELSNILHSATEDSLVILDEVGRGTATYDGISIAWAATEYLHNTVGAKTLFATHYHELTTLADHLPRVANVHVAADERRDDVTFLRTVEDGATDRSYGIHVADLAGVPEPVVTRARDVLDRLRNENAIEARGGTADGTVQAVFDLGSGQFTAASDPDSVSSTPAGEPRETATADGGEALDQPHTDRGLDPETAAVLDELRETNVNEVAPVDLLRAVQEWQERLDD